jgi:predicted enzyme related to lactoylglutathione lyase
MSSAAVSPVGRTVWVDLATPDPEAAARFYAGLLGWRVEVSETPMGRYVIGSVAEGPAAGMMAPDAPGAPPAWTVMIGVADIDATTARAAAVGATVLQPPMVIPGGDRIAVLVDPAGAVIGLMQSTQAMVWAVPGAVGWVETQSRDVAASRAFYTSVFGWTTATGDGGYELFRLDGVPVAGLMATPPEVPAAVPSAWFVYFTVADVEAATTGAARAGGSVLVAPMTVSDMRFAVLADPYGAPFGVLQA